MNRRSAEEYVRELFHYVLDRSIVMDHEVAHWAGELVAGRSPVEVFRMFATSTENLSRLEKRKTYSTKYPNGHFYSPVVNLAELESERSRIFNRGAPAGINLHPERQIELFGKLAGHFRLLPFSNDRDGKHRYYYNNTSYSFGDACIYWAMIAMLQPRTIIEVGSGYTSALALDAIDHFNLQTKCVFIDPYPDLLRKVATPVAGRHEIVDAPVQSIDLKLLERLEANDILFVDSSHVVKTGSDVHFELFEMLPRLKSGTIIHFHDMFYPFEYPETWVMEENHSWNELYVVQAFLMFNSAFEVIYFNDYVRKVHSDIILKSVPPDISSRIMVNPGGGLWLRRN